MWDSLYSASFAPTVLGLAVGFLGLRRRPRRPPSTTTTHPTAALSLRLFLDVGKDKVNPCLQTGAIVGFTLLKAATAQNRVSLGALCDTAHLVVTENCDTGSLHFRSCRSVEPIGGFAFFGTGRSKAPQFGIPSTTPLFWFVGRKVATCRSGKWGSLSTMPARCRFRVRC